MLRTFPISIVERAGSTVVLSATREVLDLERFIVNLERRGTNALPCSLDALARMRLPAALSDELRALVALG